MKLTIQVMNDETLETRAMTWDTQREILAADKPLDDEAMLDIELNLCDKRARGWTCGWTWRIEDSTSRKRTIHDDKPVDYRWIGLGII